LAAVPNIAQWRLAALPEVPTGAEVEQLLRSFDQPFPSYRRAYAMTRCLADLGLRSSEVVGLRLDDIDWRVGMVRLVKPKSRRTDVLPLPRETGRAISSYLVSERPQTTNRTVFVRHGRALRPADRTRRGATCSARGLSTMRPAVLTWFTSCGTVLRAGC
jgi:integrase